MTASRQVYVVDDDPSVREALQALFAAAGFTCETFGSAIDFLDRGDANEHACLVLDVFMPELTGVELQQRLVAAARTVPTIFITAYGDVPTAVQVMKAGAVDMLPKPLEPARLLNAVRGALERASQLAEQHEQHEQIVAKYHALTPRDREVLALVSEGLLNKQIGQRLGIGERTVKRHRTSIMQRLRLRSTADLLRLADQLEEVAPLADWTLNGAARPDVGSPPS